jgi:hypothetical protein
MQNIGKIILLVNDSFDTEKEGNFEVKMFFTSRIKYIGGENIMFNTHCFVGYFTNFMTVPYNVIFHIPRALWVAHQ